MAPAREVPLSSTPGPSPADSGRPLQERRRTPTVWKWNGARRSDPRLPRVAPARTLPAHRALAWAVLAGMVVFILLALLF